jgi:hypothetical protein
MFDTGFRLMHNSVASSLGIIYALTSLTIDRFVCVCFFAVNLAGLAVAAGAAGSGGSSADVDADSGGGGYVNGRCRTYYCTDCHAYKHGRTAAHTITHTQPDSHGHTAANCDSNGYGRSHQSYLP